MEDICMYQIVIQGKVDVDDLNTISPLKIEISKMDTNATQFTVSTDQSGLIGLMRYLHGLGLVFSSMKRQRKVKKVLG